MIQTTEWRPDTCGCVVHYTWDDEVQEDSRVHTGSKIVQACGAHPGITDPAELTNKIVDENQTKNVLLDEIFKAHPELRTTDKRGNAVLKDDAVTWSFTEDRKLQFDAPTLTKSERTAIASSVELRKGAGKLDEVK